MNVIKYPLLMDFVQLNVLGLSFRPSSHPERNHSYVLVMGEVGGNRRLPIVIGASEAVAIISHLKGLRTVRPLTHDLFRPLTEYYGVRLKQVYIHKFEDGAFFADMLYIDAYDNNFHLDARSSDAIAIAVRTTAPIYIERSIMDKMGVEFNDDDAHNHVKDEEFLTNAEGASDDVVATENLTNLSDKQLRALMQHAIDGENYEQAANIKKILVERGK